MHNLSSLIYEDTRPGFWEWDISTNTVNNPILVQSLGYTDEELGNFENAWEQIIHPDDWEKIKISVADYIVKRPEIPLVEEIRFTHKDGSTLHILLVGKITELDNRGMAAKMVGSHIDITSKKHTQRNLIRVKNLLNETSRTAMTGGWELDLETNQVIWTDVTREIFDQDEKFQPVRGRLIHLFPPGEIQDKVLSYFNNAMNNGVPFDLEVPIITPKGNPKWIRCTCQPAFEDKKCVRLFGVIQDITEKKNAKAFLHIKEQQLSTFIKYCPVAICMLDKELNYISASDVWKSFFDLKEEITGRNHFKIFNGPSDVWRERYQRALRGEVLRMDEDSFVLSNGDTEWLEWEIRPWYKSKTETGGIIVFAAVISEKHAFKQALIKARDEAEKSSRMKSKFLSVMSHEMRTPLNAVIGFINLLMQNPRPDQVENMNVLRFAAENLLLIINDVLDFSKLDADKIRLEEAEFNLTQLLHNIISSLKHEAERKNLDLQLVTDDTVPAYITGDSSRLGQIIINLVNNAIKFTNTGRVRVAYRLKESSDEAVTIRFEVEDTGIGIPFDQQENIFDMFSQADSDSTRKYGGAGLGLSISKRLLDLMGSQIRLTSVPAKGSSFSFDIMFRRAGQAHPEAREDIATSPPASVLHGAKILIVEDNPVNILLMQKVLNQWQCDCTIAQDGSIACDLVKKNDYDLILMDLQMPVMDGFKATRNIRNLPDDKYRNIPIIALSATDRSEIDVEISEAGMNDFLSKPFAPKQLNAVLIHYLSKP